MAFDDVTFLASGAALAVGAAGVVAHGVFWPRAQWFGRVVSRGITEGPPAVALTFDDGPHPGATDAILDTLARYQLRAAFFAIGVNATLHPQVLQHIDEAGHLIGSHSYDHDYAGAFRGRRYWREQLRRTDDAIAQAIGRRPTLFRPPMGFKTPVICAAARQQGQTIVTWTRRAFDGVRTTSRRIVDRLGPHARPGEILLLHDGVAPGRHRDPQPTVDALPPLIEALLSRGLRIVRLDELINPSAA